MTETVTTPLTKEAPVEMSMLKDARPYVSKHATQVNSA